MIVAMGYDGVARDEERGEDMNDGEEFDVIIVGAGAAGVGCGIMLQAIGLTRFTLLERHAVGASFARWPAEMRFITPSFPSNAYGLLDLNAVALETSPAFGLRKEHPSGQEYAGYLQTIAEHFALPIRTGVEVRAVTPLPDREGFTVETTAGVLRSRFVVWAAGEFQYPWLTPFPGAEHCRHNARVRSWAEVVGDDPIVIGGYESGIDAAANLVAQGRRVRVIGASASWENRDNDPSVSLSPYTEERLLAAHATGNLTLIGETAVTHVARATDGYTVHGDEGQEWHTSHPPILATGFIGSLQLVSDLFAWDEAEGYALLSMQDESTRTPGLFLIGPSVRHDAAIFCFIYKFRQRFAVVAHAIGERLGLDVAPLDFYRTRAMFLDDLSCCADACVC